ncbi:hypothetical protein L907_09330 [Agrobacterium sp. C13]|nr:hypothetical protein L903_09385 [Agrobacterium sp. JL28]KVK62413.1 hypothetical protein L907_09330 [Agrobacterium sp. C13]
MRQTLFGGNRFSLRCEQRLVLFQRLAAGGKFKLAVKADFLIRLRLGEAGDQQVGDRRE